MTPDQATAPTAPRLAVLGNPGHRRVTLFAAAVRAAGLPEPAVLPWSDVLRGGYAIEPGTLLRVDSPARTRRWTGCCAAPRSARGTRRPGWRARPPGTPGSPPRWRGGPGGPGRPRARLLADPAEIAVMFDKRRTHRLLAGAGVPVPPALDQSAGPVAGWADLKGRLAAAGLRRVFVKPAHGSSASGVLALEFGPRGRVSATTSVSWRDGELHNSLRVRRYRQEDEIAAIVDRLAPDGLHVERWIPKSAQRGRAADLRVVVIMRPGHPPGGAHQYRPDDQPPPRRRPGRHRAAPRGGQARTGPPCWRPPSGRPRASPAPGRRMWTCCPAPTGGATWSAR